MQQRIFNNLIAFKAPGKSPVAFHAHNLEVAEISAEAWENMASIPEITAWNEEISTEATDQVPNKNINSLTINVTQICNLHCTYCAAGGDGTYGDPVRAIAIENTLPQISFFMNRLDSGSKFHIAFLGGEPLLYPQAIGAIAEHAKSLAKEKNIEISFKVTTNGTLLTQEVVELLNRIHCAVVVSLDGPSEINDLQRVAKNKTGSTALVERGMKLLTQNRRNIPYIELHGVFNEKNMNVKTAWEYFRTLSADIYEFTYSVSTNDPEINHQFMDQINQIAASAWALGGETELRKIATFDRLFQRLDSQKRLLNHCGLGKNLAVIDSRNQIFNCPWTVGDKKNQLGHGETLFTDQFKKYERSLIEMNDCGSCWARNLCGGGCSYIHQSVGGNLENKKIDFCDRTRFITALAIGYYQQARATT